MRLWPLLLLVTLAGCAANQVGSTSAEPWSPGGADVVLFEDFDGASLDTARWNTCHWWSTDGGCTISSNDELQWYLPDNVNVNDGILRLEARIESVTGTDGSEFGFTSGMVTTGPTEGDGPDKFSFQYGGAEARVRVPAGAEFWPAFWLLPASTESRPEIDIMEMHGDEPTINGMRLHSFDDAGNRVTVNNLHEGADFTSGWHNFGVIWGPDQITWMVDGQPVKTVRIDNDERALLPDEPLYIVLNLAIDSDATPPLAGPEAFPAALEIDWVQVWQFDSVSG